MNKRHLILITAGLIISLGQGSLYAQSAPAATDPIFERIEQLKRLKQEDPEAYQKIIQDKRSRLKQHLDQFEKEGQSERRQQWIRQDKKKKQERLRQLKEKDPEKFQEFVQNRFQQMEKTAERNPQRFQEFTRNRPKFKERFQKFRPNLQDQKNIQEQPPLKKKQDSLRDQRPGFQRPQQGPQPQGGSKSQQFKNHPDSNRPGPGHGPGKQQRRNPQ